MGRLKRHFGLPVAKNRYWVKMAKNPYRKYQRTKGSDAQKSGRYKKDKLQGDKENLLHEVETRLKRNQKINFYPKIKGVADFQFRAELERMMGSEVIRLNDKNWSRRFTERLLEDYYRYEEGQAHRRAEEEKLRVHKLKVLGLIREPEIYDRRLTVCRFKKKRKSKTPDEILAIAQEKAEREHSLLLRRQTLEESQREKVYRTSVGPNIEDSIRSSFQEDSEEGGDPFLSRSALSFEERRQKSTQKRLSKNLPDDVKRIYDEESVAGLYNMAEKLVYFR